MNENDTETPEKTSVWNKHPDDLTVRDNLVVGGIVTAVTLAIPAAFIAGAALVDEIRHRRRLKKQKEEVEAKYNN